MYRYKVYPGNNSSLIKSTLEKRGNWKEADEKNAEEFKVDFIWRPVTLSLRAYHKLDNLVNEGYTIITNHLENNRVITTKTGLIRSLKAYYQVDAGAL